MPPPNFPFRIGHGFDLHRLRAGGRLVLGGVVVSEEMGTVAHSDGDVVIHALVDALLGALAWGDIGQHFPDSDPQWKGIAGQVFLEKVIGQVRTAGWSVANLDVTILLEKPRLGALKELMARNLARQLDAGGRVNIKAGSNEGVDAVGRGEAVAAHAVVLLARAL